MFMILGLVLIVISAPSFIVLFGDTIEVEKEDEVKKALRKTVAISSIFLFLAIISPSEEITKNIENWSLY